MQNNDHMPAASTRNRISLGMVIIVVIIIFCFTWLYSPGISEAAPITVINQFNTTPCATGAGNMTCTNPTIGAGSNRVLVLIVTGEGTGNHNPANTTATYGSATFTEVQNSYGNNDNRRYTWIGYINESQISTNSGSNIDMSVTSTVSWAGTEAYYAVYGGVDQAGGTSTIPGSIKADSAATTTAVSMGPITSVVDGVAIYAMSANATTGNTSVPTNYTEHVDQADASNNYFSTVGSRTSVPGTTESVSMTAVNNRWTAAFMSLAPSAGGSANITVNPTSGLTTTEAGGSATFTIVLDAAPTANVTIGLSSSDTTEGTVSPSSVTFTTGNWSTPQTITVTGVDDALVDGNIAYTIVTAAATSTDSNYSGLNPSDVSVTNTDNDVAGSPGITVNPISGLTTTEAGGTATFTIVLDSAPTANVTIGLSSSDTTEGTVSPSSVTFTTANWGTPQTVIVTGVDDLLVDGNIAYTIVTAAATSADSNYSGLNPSDVSVTNTDNDGAPPAVPVGNLPLFIAVMAGIIAYGLIWRRKQGKASS